MNIFLSQKECRIIKNYVYDMLLLFDEEDMIREGEKIYLSEEKFEVSRQDFENLKKKF